jgi:hypothetical protein
VWRILIAVGLVGCINQAAKVVNPPPEGGGTQTCAEIVEQCDAQCTNPLCLHGCTNGGTLEAQQQHDALLSCGERNGCTDEACMRESCTAEVDVCQASAVPAAGEAGDGGEPPLAPVI